VGRAEAVGRPAHTPRHIPARRQPDPRTGDRRGAWVAAVPGGVLVRSSQ